MNNPDVGTLEETEETWAKIKALVRTVFTLIDNLGIGSLAFVSYCDFLVTVGAIVPLRDIERDNEVTVGVGPTASTKSDLEEGKSGRACMCVACAFFGVVVNGREVGGKGGGEY